MPALDGLRGVAVLAVIAYHLVRRLGPDANGVAGSALAPAHFGWAGVDLFFVLSGFLITGILYDRLGSPGYFRAFYARRALRILPLHLAALLVIAAGYWLFGGAQAGPVLDSIPWHASFLTNVRVALADSWRVAPAGTGHLWSLAVEEQFYLVWPLAMVLVARAHPAAPQRALMVLCVGVALTAVAVRVLALRELPLAAYTLFPARMDALAVGSGLALWVRGPRGPAPALMASGPVAIACAGALVVIGLVHGAEEVAYAPLQRTVGYSLWALLFGAVVAKAAVAGPGGVLARGPLAWTGRISFGLYVIHYPVIYALAAVGARDMGDLAFSAAVVAVTFALAAVSWRYVERPALDLKHHFRYRAAPALTA